MNNMKASVTSNNEIKVRFIQKMPNCSKPRRANSQQVYEKRLADFFSRTGTDRVELIDLKCAEGSSQCSYILAD